MNASSTSSALPQRSFSNRRAKLLRAFRALYAVTPDDADTRRLSKRVAAALAGGASIVQYRNKSAAPALRREQALALKGVCAIFSAPFFINDHLDLALEIDADGLHVGGGDGDVATLRTALGPHRLLGVSCYADLAAARAAVDAGADYVAFGSVFPSRVKPDAVRAPLSIFPDALSLHVPIVGIGGITLENLPTLVAVGADAAAIVSDLFDAGDVARRARQLAACFNRSIVSPNI